MNKTNFNRRIDQENKTKFRRRPGDIKHNQIVVPPESCQCCKHLGHCGATRRTIACQTMIEFRPTRIK